MCGASPGSKMRMYGEVPHPPLRSTAICLQKLCTGAKVTPKQEKTQCILDLLGLASNLLSAFVQYCTFGTCKLVFFRTCVDRYGGALAVLGMSENPRKPSFRSPNGLLAPFLA